MADNYQDHIAQCNQLAQGSPANLVRAITFALATIQQQLETVPDIVQDFEAVGSASRFAFGSKAKGLDWLAVNGDQLYRDAMSNLDNPRELLRVFLQCPGLGLVKAGFTSQLISGHVGCLDVHNIRMYSIPMASLRYSYPKSTELQQTKAQAYVDLCQGLGGSVALWANWCHYVAQKRPGNWSNGLAVSQLHVDCLAGRYMPADLYSNVDFEPRFRSSALD